MKKLAVSLILVVMGTMAIAAEVDGSAIFKKCAACHGAQAQMTYAGKVPPLAGKDSNETITALEGYLKGKQNSYGMGAVMGMQAKIHLKSPEEIQAVADYIQSLGDKTAMSQ